MSFRPMDVMTNPQTLMKVWIDEPMPLSFYTEKEKEVQKLFNEKEDGIIAYSPEGKLYTRDIDQEEITPFTWKWVHFEIKEENGGYTKAYLRRPNWWLKKVGATEIGKIVPLSMYEIGVEGNGKVTKISPNQLDTRLWDLNRNGDYVSRPITGKVEHYANNVVDLYFDNSLSSPLSVTTNHLIWSYDRNDWFRVDALNIGEKIKTQRGNVTLTQRIPKEGWFVVYDLEVYRDHNFLVGNESILAHNGCIFKTSKLDDIKKWKATEPDMQSAGGVAKYEKMLKEGDPYVFKDPIKTTTIDGQTYIIDGHHRLQAAKNIGYDKPINHVEIPIDEISQHSGFKNAQEVIDAANQ